MQQFSWVNTTTVTLNSTMNGFYDEVSVSYPGRPHVSHCSTILTPLCLKLRTRSPRSLAERFYRIRRSA